MNIGGFTFGEARLKEEAGILLGLGSENLDDTNARLAGWREKRWILDGETQEWRQARKHAFRVAPLRLRCDKEKSQNPTGLTE